MTPHAWRIPATASVLDDCVLQIGVTHGSGSVLSSVQRRVRGHISSSGTHWLWNHPLLV